MSLVRTIKRGVLGVSRRTGLTRAVAGTSWRQNRLLILCYHGISQLDEHLWNRMYVERSFFARRLDFLARGGYQVLPLGVAVARLRARDLPSRSVCITFDDGFCDFLQHAVPALCHHAMPATVYLTTYYATHPYPLYNLILSYLFWRGSGKIFDASALGLSHSIVLGARANDNHALVSAFLRDAKTKGLSPSEKNDVARGVASRLGEDFEQIMATRLLQMMNPGELRESVSTGMDIQLHTHRHRTPLDKPLFVQEIEDNRAWIQRELGIESTHFCYPSGGYHRGMLPWLRELGIESATTCDHALATPDDDLLLLPRLLDSMSISDTEFEGWLSGFSSLLPHRRVNVPELG